MVNKTVWKGYLTNHLWQFCHLSPFGYKDGLVTFWGQTFKGGWWDQNAPFG